MPMVRVSNGGTNSVMYIGTVPWNSSTYSVNVSSILPNYSELTADNFFLNITAIWYRGTPSGAPTLAKNYNSSTGDLTIAVGVVTSGTSYLMVNGNVYYTSTPLPTS